MTVAESKVERPSVRRRIRNGALGWLSVALAFYFGIIAIFIYRGRH